MKNLKLLCLFLCFQACIFHSFAQYYEDYELIPDEKDGRFGYVLPGYHDVELIIPYQFDAADDFSEGLARVKKDGKYGFIDKWGILQIDYEYEDAGSFWNDCCPVKKNGFWGYIDHYNNPVIDFKYEMAVNFSSGIFPVAKNGKFGFINEKNETVVDFLFDKIYPFIENSTYAMIEDTLYEIELPGVYISKIYPDQVNLKLGNDITGNYSNGKWSLFNQQKGEALSEVFYDNLNYYSEGFISASLEGKWGFIDTEGNRVIDFQYDDAGYFGSGLANVKVNGKWGYIDKDNQEIIPCQFDFASSFYKDLAWVIKDQMVYPVDRSGTRQATDLLQKILHYSEGLAAINIDNKFGFINKKGEIIISPRFDFASDFHSGRSRIHSGSGYGYIDKSGELIINDVFYVAQDFHKGAAIVWGKHKFGYEILDTMGNYLSDYQFIEIRPYHEGLAAANEEQSPEIMDPISPDWKSSKWGYIDTNGNTRIGFQFEWAQDFNKGYAPVSWGYRESGFIDETGKPVSMKFFDLQFDKDIIIGARLDENQQNTYYAIVGHDGTVLSDWFSEIGKFKNGITVAVKNDRGINLKALLHKSGSIISDFYHDIADFSMRLYLAEKKDSNYNSLFCFLDRTGTQTCEWFSELKPVYGGYQIVTKYSDDFETFRTMADPVTGALGKEWFHDIAGFDNGISLAENLAATPYGDVGLTCIDLKGNRLCDFYEDVSNLGEGFCIVFYEDQYGLVTRSGLFPLWFGDYEDPAEGIIMIYAKKRYWIIDNSGRLITRDKRIREVMPFHEGRAAVANKKGLYGFLDKNGNVVIDFLYDYVNDFEGGAALVSQDGSEFYIDHEGNRIVN